MKDSLAHYWGPIAWPLLTILIIGLGKLGVTIDPLVEKAGFSGLTNPKIIWIAFFFGFFACLLTLVRHFPSQNKGRDWATYIIIIIFGIVPSYPATVVLVSTISTTKDIDDASKTTGSISTNNEPMTGEAFEEAINAKSWTK